jgi:cation diffusion facilitator CzcD-associated flavoprotein CzcO
MSGATGHVEVAVVGAGFAGIGMAMALRRSGIDSFAVLERAASIGGTWRDNTYPGIACDVPSHLYGFAGHPNPQWSGVYATGSEIRCYLERVADVEDVRPELETPVEAAMWDDAARCWRLELGGPNARALSADVLILACGRLTEPAIPELPGLDSFPGPLFHTARWDHTAELNGARIAVVGTGASAVQVVPELARLGQVTLFQRTPAWIVPREARAYSDAERAEFAADPAHLLALRSALYAEGEARFASRSGDPAAASAARAVAQGHLAAQVADPTLRSALTPDYAFGCKRVLLSDEFYPAVASDAVTLVPSALAAVDGSTLVAADGTGFQADVLVLATGFASARQPYADLIRGEHTTLAEHWATGMTSFGSTAVAGFPNMFVLNGPNASLGHNSSVLMTELQAGYVARTLHHRRRRGGVLKVRVEAETAYSAEIDRAAAATPWLTGGCQNWYVDPRSGRLTLLWPGTVEAFRERLARADGSEFEAPAHASTPGKG